MGGFGSGRKWGKTCTEDMTALDVRKLARDGRLEPGTSCRLQWSSRGEVFASIAVTVEADRVFLVYRQRDQGDEWQDMRYPVYLDRTPCTFGGERLWWRCPAAGCGRRVAVLFGGKLFACRHCHQLAYRSQRETEEDRATRQAGKIRDRLGWTPGIAHPAGGKPKGMHWSTFWRLRAEHDAHALAALTGCMARLDAIRSKVARLRL